MNQLVLFDQKWIKFLRRTWLFRHIPFVDFALAAGSMALGNVTPNSDFDVIVGVRSGRIFTARFFSILIFGLFGLRRKRLDHREAAADKICLNHFVTPETYRLSPPYNEYWRRLYSNLVPVFGSQNKIADFFRANSIWLNVKNKTEKFYDFDLRYKYKTPSRFKLFSENILNGSFGDFFEKFLKRLQVKRIEKGLKNGETGYQPRIIYNDQELEFHPDTKRMQYFLESHRG